MGQEVHPMVPVPEAIRIVIRETARILLEQESEATKTLSSLSPWNELMDQVLDKDVLMNEPGYPPYNASIMDGYAVRTDEFQKSRDEGWTHQVLDKVYAGDEVAPKQQQDSGSRTDLPSAYYITTGAVIPNTCNCVVPIEECDVSEDKTRIRIHPTATIADQKWIRPIGCDIPAGSVVLPRGHYIDPVALGLLKQSGAESIRVKRKIVVGVLSTGNELIIGLGPKKDAKSQSAGKIPDVNRPILLSQFSSYGICEAVDLGNERDDDVDAMAKTVEKSLETCDVIITTGGISMGETDIVEHVLVEKCGGKLHFGRMHMKPGKSANDHWQSILYYFFIPAPKS
jgi:molybdenum cofactor synthesis domain-containing protein